jgi:hypothetical protein
MNLAAIRAELENEQTWRQNEIRFLRNQLAHIPSRAFRKFVTSYSRLCPRRKCAIGSKST